MVGFISSSLAAVARPGSGRWLWLVGEFGDVERVEITEAFAAIAIACINELGLPVLFTNIHGGTIAHAFPSGATGPC